MEKTLNCETGTLHDAVRNGIFALNVLLAFFQPQTPPAGRLALETTVDEPTCITQTCDEFARSLASVGLANRL